MKESLIQHNVMAACGALPGVLLWRNLVGHYFTRDGQPVRVGLGVGSPDLVGVRGGGHMFGLELKVPGKRADPHQARVHDIWRRFGIDVWTVHSVEEALACLATP